MDTALAERLRAILGAPARHVAASPPARPDRIEPVGEPVDPPAVAAMARIDENDPIADLIVQGPGSSPVAPSTAVADEPAPIADPFVQEPDQHAETSWYPSLPSPADDDSEQTDATETVLRDIRNRLTTPTSASRRRLFRRRFTVASGLSAVIALGLLATNVGYGITQLHV